MNRVIDRFCGLGSRGDLTTGSSHLGFIFFLFKSLYAFNIVTRTLATQNMLLRDHPFISCYGIKSWPPTWLLLNGPGVSRLTGEIGILKGIRVNDLQSTGRCLLYMQHEESSYLGWLLFHDLAFCTHITELLQSCCNRPIAEIGSLDLTHTLC
jgi:hypothetical protein